MPTADVQVEMHADTGQAHAALFWAQMGLRAYGPDGAPRALIAREDVPAGRLFVMWHTDGSHEIYVNRTWMLKVGDRIKRQPPERLLGYPVVYEES